MMWGCAGNRLPFGAIALVVWMCPKKVITVPSASSCTCFFRYRRSAMMQFNDSEMQMGRKESEVEKICILT